tara:strand:+ start:1177 stop:2415 length:1239 start_codon:yes stop_codon:yes gene_type:complete
MLNVVVLNGGRGAAALIPALIEQPDLQVTSIVNAYDDGKSTGEIRRFFGMLGPSDIRKVQELMLPKNDVNHKEYLKLFRFRFAVNCSRDSAISQINDFISTEKNNLVGAKIESKHVNKYLKIMLKEFVKCLSVIEKLEKEEFDFSDCSIMNCIYAGAFIYFRRNIERATLFVDRLFRLRGTVISTSNENRHLVALRENGEVIYTEADIVELRSNVRISRLFLLEYPLDKDKFKTLTENEKYYYLDRHHSSLPVSPSVKLALTEADIIIYSSGTQHSSLYPSYLSSGLAETIADNRNATKVFITNIGADYETPMYQASDYIYGAHRYLELSGERKYSMEDLFTIVLINKNQATHSSYVRYDEEGFKDISIPKIVDNFESKIDPGKHDGALLVKQILNTHTANYWIKTKDIETI